MPQLIIQHEKLLNLKKEELPKKKERKKIKEKIKRFPNIEYQNQEDTLELIAKNGNHYIKIKDALRITIGGIILFFIFMGVLAESIDVDDGTGDRSSLFDAESKVRIASYNKVDGKYIVYAEIADNDNILSKHILKFDESLLESDYIDMSKVDISSDIDRQGMKRLISGFDLS